MLDIFDDTVDVWWSEEVNGWYWLPKRVFLLNMNRIKDRMQYATKTS